MTTIYTIGHSTHSQDKFLELLKMHDIDMLVDIRSYPGSRKYPHFNKENMEVWLREHNIEYSHLLKLGGRRNKIKDVDYSLVDEWKHPSFRNYAAYTLTNQFEEGIKDLLTLAENNKIAYCCSEHTHKKCHRGLVSDTLTAMGINVLHILSNGQLKEHDMTQFAVVERGHVIYPSKQLSLF